MANKKVFWLNADVFVESTANMSATQTGQYIRLLCQQNVMGHLSEPIMKSTMGGTLDPLILSKFSVDEKGNYYNKGLETEEFENGLD